jgi:divalent metal cation (Fe/Co/Zn/Cd) transporter
MATDTPVAPVAKSKGFIKRELNGATFLTLEHIGHMALVVIVSGLVLSGIMSALSMWFGTAGMSSALMGGARLGVASSAVEGALSLGVVAALLVLVPLLVILDRRTRAEWNKRPGFAGRLAYKVPVYSALAVLAAAVVACKIQMLYVILSSLAFIGVSGAPIGSLYVDHFVPALLGAIVFGAAGWYLFTLAKGRDHGRTFSMAAAVLAGAVSIALFITTLVVLHDGTKSFSNPSVELDPGAPTTNTPTYDEEYYRDLMDKYYQ